MKLKLVLYILAGSRWGGGGFEVLGGWECQGLVHPPVGGGVYFSFCPQRNTCGPEVQSCL